MNTPKSQPYFIKMKTSKEIRQSFLDFFQSKQHHIVPSAPMVIKDDPTLMFTNAGMNQFKNIILGNDPVQYPRVADTQKCLRVSGKHNDLEEVGHDTYHHTMFEMLGNWSFGDYFKKEAIEWAWEYLTGVLGLDKDRLYVTVFEGEEPLKRDDEAAEVWEKFVPKNRIINGSKKDNFWEMGDTGPCGPCSEIHIDIRPDSERTKVDGLSLVNKNHPQVIEIWNLVFMQYNRKADGSLEPLPAKVIDTGMGFERLCMALQGKTSNYDTDIFTPIIKEIEKITTSLNPPQGDLVDTPLRGGGELIAMRVIADHIRTIAFSITDGQLPSNAKAGYVIRRILRRAVRYGYTFLGQRDAFMYKLLPALIESMGDAYPELQAQKTLIEKVIKEEEEAFLRTLDAGIRLLDKVMAETKAAGNTEISGVNAFTLYDTYGFPLDLTELILHENNLTVNLSEFDREMQKQKERARNAAAVEAGDWIIVNEGESEFVGFDMLETETHILRYRQVKQKNKTYYQLVLSRTPFYAEMGGQAGDSGYLVPKSPLIHPKGGQKSAAQAELSSSPSFGEGWGEMEIFDTKRENNLAVHLVNSLPFTSHSEDLGGSFIAKVNVEKRTATENNHSATHLLHEALREVLGKHVEQKGSFVSPEALRFDFSHFQKVNDEELRKVEMLVNAKIRENRPLDEYRDVPIAEARAMGAMALFGEKYGERVRVVRFGSSVELCGGTHVKATGQIGFLKIVYETSVAAGIRRIEAVTGAGAEKYVQEQQDMITGIRMLFNNAPNIVQTIQKSIEENDSLKKQVENFFQERILTMRDRLIEKAEDVNGVKLICHRGEDNPELIRGLAAQFRGKFTDMKFAFIAGSLFEGKPSLTLFISKPMVDAGYNAAHIIRDAATYIDGGGGGQPFMATAGGKKPNGLEKAMERVAEMISKN